MSLIIKEVAKSKGITLTELADRLGITKSGMNQHVNGNPSVEVLQRIADALNVHISDLFEKPQTEEISGFVKVKGEVREIKSKKDLENILENL